MPERPIRTIRIPGIDAANVYLSPDKRTLAYKSSDKVQDTGDITNIILIPELRNIAPAELKHNRNDNVTYRFLAGGELLAIDDMSGSWMIEIPSGTVRWQAKRSSAFWRYSDDGRIALANAHFQIIVFDTSQKEAGPTLRLDAQFDRWANRFQLNRNGRRLAMPDQSAAGRVILWDTILGKEIARFEEPKYSSIYHVEVSPDDSKLAAEGIYGPAHHAVRAVVFWDINSREKTLLTTKNLDAAEPGYLLFSHDGRQMRYYPKCWDVTVSPPVALPDVDPDANYEAPEANRYFKNALAEDGDTVTDRWTMFACDSRQPIASGVGHRPLFSNNKWVLFQQELTRESFLESLLELLPIQLERTKIWLDVYSLENGKRTTRIPIQESRVYDCPINDRIWTMHTAMDEINARNDLILCEWSCYAAPPPWWLLLVTIGGMVSVAYELRRAPRGTGFANGVC